MGGSRNDIGRRRLHGDVIILTLDKKNVNECRNDTQTSENDPPTASHAKNSFQERLFATCAVVGSTDIIVAVVVVAVVMILVPFALGLS